MILSVGIIMDIIFFSAGLVLGNMYIQYFSTVILYFMIMVYYTKRIRENVVLWAFLVSFGMFMFARILIRPIISGEWLWTKFNNELAQHTFLCLEIAMLSILIGNLSNRYKFRFNNSGYNIMVTDIGDESLTCYIEKVSCILFFMTIPFKALAAVYTIAFVRATSYSSQYLVGGAYMPGWVDSFSRAHIIIFLIFLASLPLKKKVYIYSIIEIGVLGISLFSGNRFEFMCMLVLLYVYFWFRERNAEGEMWINYKFIFMIMIIVIGVMFLLQFVSIARGNQSNLISDNYFIGFLDSTGYSVEIIPLSKKHQLDFFGSNVMYFWEPLFRIFKSFTGIGTYYSGQTVESAQYGYNFGGTLTYLESSWLYTVTGGGLGSSYIAELFHSYGYISIILFNLILGRVINKIEIRNNSKWVIRVITLIILFNLFKMPRSNCWIWAEDLISKVTLTAILSVYSLSLFLYQRNNK